LDDECNKQCNNCNLKCIVRTAKFIVVGDIKIIIAQGDKKT
jgi:hypothetical protein